MQNKQLQDLIEKYQQGQCSDEEIALLESWYLQWNETGRINLSEDQLRNARHRDEEELKPYLTRPTAKLWPRIAVAAAAVAAITLGTWLYTSRHPDAALSSRVSRDLNDIAPGSVGATLTLANGKTIKLSSATNGELAKEAGVTITKSADGQLIYDLSSASSLREGTTKQSHTSNTLTTAKGETYQVKLPDGTAVWLNAASSLTYPASLTAHGKRVVRLSGEAYFQVAKDKTHPFIVESKSQKVEVLGTHFNINSYADEGSTKTTLLEGSVSVSSLRGKHSDEAISQGAAVILKPNQQSVVSGSNRISVKDVDPEEAMAWKNGDVVFTGKDFRAVMRSVARWYDVEIVYDPSVPKDLESTGIISRNNKISAVLKRIETTGQVHFKIEGRRILVTK